MTEPILHEAKEEVKLTAGPFSEQMQSSPLATAYDRSILPDLDCLPLPARLKAGFLVGAGTVVVGLVLIWAIVAAATLASAQPETIGRSLGYIVWFVPNLLMNPDSWIAVLLVVGVSVFGMLRPRTRPPAALALSLWAVLCVVLTVLVLVPPNRVTFEDPQGAISSLGVAAVLFWFHGGFVATIFFLVYRKAQALLTSRSAQTKELLHNPPIKESGKKQP